MKAPRQVLFDKHRTAQPALDQVRRNALAALPGRMPIRQALSPVRFVRELWSNLIVPSRRAWGALGVAWVFILGFTLSQATETPSHQAQQLACSPEVVMALRQQQREFKELVHTETPAPESTEPQRQRTAPRSSLKPIILAA